MSRVLDRVRTPVTGDEKGNVESLLAVARAALALISFAALSLDRSSIHDSAPLKAAVGAYAIAAVAILALLRVRQQLATRAAPIVHAADVAWAAGISVWTSGSGGASPPFLGFVLVAAACRWGFRETLATAAAALVPLLGTELVAGPRPGRGHVLWLTAGLLVVAVPLGRLAEQQRQVRAQIAAAARTMSKVHPEAGLTRTLEAVLNDFLGLFGASRVLLVAHEPPSSRVPSRERRRRTRPGRLFLWESRLPAAGGDPAFHATEVDASERDIYLFEAPAESWYAVDRKRRGGERRFDVVGLTSGGVSLTKVGCELPPRFVESHLFRSLLAVSASFGEEWNDRLFVFDPNGGAAELPFLRTLVRQVGPAIYSVYLLGRLQTRISAGERARVARELHDGITQSLIGLEMQVEAWRRESGPDATSVSEKLAHIQRLLRQEILNLREVMEQMKPLYLDPQHLLDFLSELVAKFQRETGINAHFVTDVEQVAMAPPICIELGRIAQEALVNVRRHSGAANVIVRFTADDGCWSLVVDDDGRGFPFAGRYSHAELEADRKGPLVIKERVRSIGGELAIDSRPGVGSRVEVTLPSHAS